MKKLLLGAAFLSAVSATAQIDLSSRRFGLTAGANYARVSNAHNPSGGRLTMQAGALALIPIDDYDQFYLQPEVLYYGAGESGKDPDKKNLPGYDAVYGDSYISVPVYFKAYFSEAESEFFGMIGPRFNFLLNQNMKKAPQRYTVEGDPVTGVNGKAAGFNFMIGAGLGFSYKRQLELALKYDLGLSNTYPNMVESATGDPNTEKSKSQHVVGVGLSYIFE